MDDHLATVNAIYAAFGAGDIPALLDYLGEDVQWEAWADNQAQQAGVPWLQGGQGKAAVAAFFQAVGAMTMHDFRVLDMLASDRQVAVEVALEVTLPNGRRFADEELQLWTVDDAGRVTRMRHYLDTAKHIAAHRG